MNFPSDSVLLPAKKYLPLPAVPARTNEVPVSFYQTKYKKKYRINLSTFFLLYREIRSRFKKTCLSATLLCPHILMALI